MRDECTHCGTPKSDDYVCCAWAENDALRARLAEAERLLRRWQLCYGHPAELGQQTTAFLAGAQGSAGGSQT